jgi:hypothetical protein
MKRVWLFAAAHVILGAAWAQDVQLVSAKIDAGACATFLVDGTRYSKAAFFTWPEGSRHFLSLEAPPSLVGLHERCKIGSGWQDNTGVSHRPQRPSLQAVPYRHIPPGAAGNTTSWLQSVALNLP